MDNPSGYAFSAQTPKLPKQLPVRAYAAKFALSGGTND
jgi:hypothetical protein